MTVNPSASPVPRVIDSIPSLLARFPTISPPRRSAEAAVVLVLRQGTTEVETLLIERTTRRDDLASGQVSLPGGKYEEGDDSLAQTALRELQEEVGLTAPDLADPPRYVCTESAAAFQLKVAVFAASLGTRASHPRARSRAEVAKVFWLPRSALSHPVLVPRETTAGLREVEATVYQSHVVWGFTFSVLRRFFSDFSTSKEDPSDSTSRSLLPSREGPLSPTEGI